MKNGLFIEHVEFMRDKVEDFNRYPFNIPVIKDFHEVNFTAPVTFLIGENGIGKSTFMEALAVAVGLNPEGGTQNFMFSTKETHSELYHYFEVPHFQRRCMTKFFLRAESFYNVITEIDELKVAGYGRQSLHTVSHGESFITLIQNRFTENGLYILDEPEAALSPTRQMTLLCLIDELVKQGSQFIIATHSPILISYIHGKILDLNDGFKETRYEDTELYQVYKMYLANPYGMQKRLFEEEIE